VAEARPSGAAYDDPDTAPPPGAGAPPAYLRVTIGSRLYRAVLETAYAPETCALVRTLLPLRGKLLQSRWSGEAAWVALGRERQFELPWERQTSFPLPGHLLFYPGGTTQPEILLAYGASLFGSKVGQLVGNHFATLLTDPAGLGAIGQSVLWHGAQDFLMEPE
jgi:hypothetical protein